MKVSSQFQITSLPYTPKQADLPTAPPTEAHATRHHSAIIYQQEW